MWALRSWVGRYLPPGGDRRAELATYTSWCTAVEGNTTFYALPTADTVRRWAEATPEDFQFCFKVPRTISHDRRLRSAEAELTEFCERLEPLGSRLGPSWVQLPATFGPDDLGVLDRFCAALPRDRAWAVEVRHRAFEADGSAEREVNDLLHRHGVDRVLIDSRALFAGPCVTPEEIEAFGRKPRLRIRPVAVGPRPSVRFIGQTDPEANPEFWAPWVAKVAAWLEEGRRPMVFIHTPDNAVSPTLARAFHDEVRAVVPDLEPLPEPPPSEEQPTLF